MPKYHISKDGQARKCSAKTVESCRATFAGNSEHYDSIQDAQLAYESSQKVFEKKANVLKKNSKPDFDVNGERGFWSPRTPTVNEKKNKGEFSEILAAVTLLTKQNIYTANGENLSISAMTLGVGESKVDYIVESDEQFFFKTKDEKVFSYFHDGNEDEKISNAIKNGTGRAFSSETIQRACLNLGFADGKVPKAQSTEKADIIAWDTAGNERRISVKSYLGSDPALINASKASQVNYSADIPQNIEYEKISTIINKANSLPTTKQKIAFLKLNGISFDATSGVVSPEFKKNLSTISENSEKAYSAAVFSSVSDKKIPSALHDEYANVLTAFATKMTHTTMTDEGSEVTDLMIIDNQGRPRIIQCSDEDYLKKHLINRVSFNEPAKGKFDSGVISIKDGKINMMLNAFGSLSLNSKTSTPIK